MDSDPTPGDPEEVRELADELQMFSDDVAEGLGKVRGLASDRAVLDWAGLSAEAFRNEFDGVPGNLEKLRDSYDLCAQALQTYWPKLQTAQGQADRALDRAIAAQADLTSAQGALGDAQGWVSRAGEEAERLQREGERDNAPPPDEAEVRAATRDRQAADEARESAQARVDSAQDSLDAARELARQAKEMREEAARQAARDIDEASDAGIQNRKWWQKAVHWVTENWDTIVDICKIVVAVLGIVVMIIGGPLAWVVLAAALVVLADTLVKYANGEASLWDVAFAALDCIPGLKGLTTLGGLARGLRGGLAAARTGLRGIRQGVRGLGQALRRLGRGGDDLVCRTDPIDMATGEMVMYATDVSLPGVLPLVLERHHRTTLREGTWFGRSWASTLDQRLVFSDGGVRFVTADGMVLDYPRPQPGHPVLPVEGPRWELDWDGSPGTPLTVRQPDRRLVLSFRPVQGRTGGELPLTALTDTNGNRMEIAYDASGAPGDVTHTGGHHIGVTSRDGRITELRLLSHPDRPVLRSFAYDERGNLAEVRDSSGVPQRLAYDRRRRITGWDDRNGRWYRYTYDDKGRCVATDGTDGFLSSTIAYDPAHHRTTFTDALGHTTVYQFDDSYRLVAETDPLGHTTRREHDRYDRLVSVTDPLGRTTRYAHDEHGRVARVTRPDGREVHMENNALGLPERITEADGAVWQQEFDTAGNRLSVTDPAGAVTRYTWDPQGGPRTVTDPLGNVTAFTCDDAGRPVSVTDPTGRVTRYRRDPFGRPVQVTEPGGGVRLLEWSVEGRPLRHTDPLGGTQTWRWDGEGNCLAHTDENGGETTFAYGPFDQPTVQVRPDGARYVFHRDAELRLLRVTDPLARTWEYTYDAAGRLAAETDFDGRTTHWTRDAAGQPTSRTDPLGRTIAFTRDAMGRVTAKDADGRVTRYEHDAADRLVRAVGPDAELLIERDPVGRVVAETCDGHTVTYAFDALARPVRRTTPAGVTSRWTYDPAGRPVSLATAGGGLDFAYDDRGRESRRALGGDTALHRAWDPAGHLVGQTLVAGGQPLRDRSYTYRADHYLTSVGGDEDIRFALDPLGRVTEVATPSGADETYAYDEAGNQALARWSDDGGDTAAVGGRRYDGTALTGAGQVRYEHDGAGRVVLRQHKRLSRKPATWHYEWDVEGRLTAVRTPDGDRWRYRYDPLGRRIAKERLAADGAPAERVRFVWDGATLIEQHADAPGAPGASRTVTWDHVGNHPVAQVERTRAEPGQDERDARFLAVVTDTVGAPTELVDGGGRIAWRGKATLWGVGGGTSADGTTTPLRFPGQYADEETGWHYNFHRHYDPATARYSSPDPMGLTAAPNSVAYVHNPHIWSDPLGLEGYLDFFTVQSPEDATRLRGDGTPWPGEATRGQWGDGVYSWGTRQDADAYADLLRNRRGATVEILHFRVSEADFTAMNRADITAMTPDDAEAFMDRHSRLYGDGVPHGRDYIRGFTSNFGNEHFFSTAVFCRLKFS
ncbi:DUF6531 domain-containing protein [Streptomyces sp. MS19]|uniref:DUF6531 domain-containing protein n=1 Tax=Streptomyces sp. MS19 TaxID=3385972 RepID=UPI0039A247FD